MVLQGKVVAEGEGGGSGRRPSVTLRAVSVVSRAWTPIEVDWEMSGKRRSGQRREQTDNTFEKPLCAARGRGQKKGVELGEYL